MTKQSLMALTISGRIIQKKSEIMTFLALYSSSTHYALYWFIARRKSHEAQSKAI